MASFAESAPTPEPVLEPSAPEADSPGPGLVGSLTDEVALNPVEVLEAAVAEVELPPAAEPAIDVAAPANDDPLGIADDELCAALDDVFGGAASSNASPAAPAEGPALAHTNHDELAVKDLFASIASNHSVPVKNFIADLQRGTASKEWIEICRPVMHTMIDAAESIDLPQIAERMVDFGEALTLAQNEAGPLIDGEGRDLILSCYDDLVEALPDTFRIVDNTERRESVLVHSLLRQIPGVGHVTFEKLYGAGLTSLDTLFVARPDELTVVTGIQARLSERICSKVQEHRERLGSQLPDQLFALLRTRLAERVQKLRDTHETFERASRKDITLPEVAEAKRQSRRKRQACALQINVVLAEMGELDLVDEIKKLAFGRRIERLEKFLRSAEDADIGIPHTDAGESLPETSTAQVE
ncbi:MAG: hypothetical protein GY716_05575 [bacterium]|nr:hypothetical protein [bacterium]